MHSVCTICWATFLSGFKIVGMTTTLPHPRTGRRGWKPAAVNANCAADRGSVLPSTSTRRTAIASSTAIAAAAWAFAWCGTWTSEPRAAVHSHADRHRCRGTRGFDPREPTVRRYRGPVRSGGFPLRQVLGTRLLRRGPQHEAE